MKTKVNYTIEEAKKLQSLYQEAGIECKKLNKALRKPLFDRFYDLCLILLEVANPLLLLKQDGKMKKQIANITLIFCASVVIMAVIAMVLILIK